MNSKPQKISLCGDEILLTIKSNNIITITLEEDDEREETDFKRI